MTAAVVSVRPAERADVGALADVLAKAFYDDPPFVWILPDDKTRLAHNRGVFSTLLRFEALPHGVVDAAVDAGPGRIVGGAVWFPPGTWPSSLSVLQGIRALHGYARALGRRLGPASDLVRALAPVHPRTPHWYLYAIGVDPAYQGRGVGGALLRSRLERVDQEGKPAYLESSKPGNIPIYEHFGFQVAEVPPLPDGAPVITPMSRAARQRGRLKAAESGFPRIDGCPPRPDDNPGKRVIPAYAGLLTGGLVMSTDAGTTVDGETASDTTSTVSHPTLQTFTLDDLAVYTAEGAFGPTASKDFRMFYVGRDDVHGVLMHLFTRVSLSVEMNMFGYDDDALNAVLLGLVRNPNVVVQVTLDKSQAAGPAERGILSSDEAADAAGFANDFAIGTSSTDQISHTKGGVLDGIVAFEGSTNWSASGEGTGITLNAAKQVAGFKAQNNTLSVYVNPYEIAKFAARLKYEHGVAAAQRQPDPAGGAATSSNGDSED